MEKIAILAHFEPMTRMVIEVPENLSKKEFEKYILDNADSIVEVARNRMIKQINDYLSFENFVWEIDYECPAKDDEEISK